MITQICGVDIPPCHERGIRDEDCYSKCKHRKANQMHEYSDGCGCKSCYSMRVTHDKSMRGAVDTRIPHVNGCDCVDCCNRRAAERMRAATCRCGHIGAGCFNDEYCAEPKIDKVTFEGDGTTVDYHYAKIDANEYSKALKAARHLEECYANALNEIQAMKEAHKEESAAKELSWGVRYHALKQHCDSILADKNALEVKLQTRIIQLESNFNSAVDTAQAFQDLLNDAMDTINDLQADYAYDCHVWAGMYNAIADSMSTLEADERIEQLETTIRVLSGMIE